MPASSNETVPSDDIVKHGDDDIKQTPSEEVEREVGAGGGQQGLEKGDGILKPEDQHARVLVDEVDTSGIDEKKLLRKLDWRLIPFLSLLYLLSFLDRTAVGNAKLYGLETDIGVTDNQYLVGLTIFFISYAVFEPPSNVLLKKLRPSIYLPIIMFLWGIAMLCQGLIHNYSGLLATRWFLGVFEAGLFPGVNYLLSCWYKRTEFGLRAALFFSAATVSGAFGGLLAAAISNLNGRGGKPGWAWIFIIEGLLTIVIAAAAPFVLEDFPDKAKFLTLEERAFVIKRLQEDDQFSAAGEGFKWANIRQSLVDWKTYVGMFMYMGVDGPLYAFALFTPTIINQLGYSATPANLLSVPIYVWACILTIGVGFLADKQGHRIIYNFIFLALGAAGYIILIASRKAALSYFAIYLAAAGIYPLIPNTISIVSNNTEGSYKRSLTLAMVIGWGNLNGAVSSNVYRAKDAPWYSLGHGIVLLYIGIGFISTTIMYFGLKRENRLRDEGKRDEIIGGEGPFDEKAQGISGNGRFRTVEEARAAKGDNWSGYRYIL